MTSPFASIARSYVKVFTGITPEELENKVNDFVSECSQDLIRDVKFTVTSMQGSTNYLYSALVLYDSVE